MCALVNAHADTPILVQTEEHVAMSARHHMHERGGVTLERQGTDGLSDLGVHHHNLPRVDEEEVVFVCGGEDNLSAVDLSNTLLSSDRGEKGGREGGA